MTNLTRWEPLARVATLVLIIVVGTIQIHRTLERMDRERNWADARTPLLIYNGPTMTTDTWTGVICSGVVGCSSGGTMVTIPSGMGMVSNGTTVCCGNCVTTSGTVGAWTGTQP